MEENSINTNVSENLQTEPANADNSAEAKETKKAEKPAKTRKPKKEKVDTFLCLLLVYSFTREQLLILFDLFFDNVHQDYSLFTVGKRDVKSV